MAGAWDLVPATTKNEIQLITIPSAKFHIKKRMTMKNSRNRTIDPNQTP